MSLIQDIRFADLASSAADSPSSGQIRDASTLASYSWTLDSSPKIIVPGESQLSLPCHFSFSFSHSLTGRPPYWTPPGEETRVPRDNTTMPADVDLANYPRHPAEATARAILACNPGPGHLDIQVVVPAKVLDALVRAFLGQRRDVVEIIVETVGETSFLSRKEGCGIWPLEEIDVRAGFGLGFPDLYTSQEEGAGTHHRVVSYKLNEMRVAVGFKSDGCDGDNWGDGERQVLDLQRGPQDVFDEKPVLVPMDLTWELITRRGDRDRGDILNDRLPSLWVRQMGALVVATHAKGGWFAPDYGVEAVESQVLEFEAAEPGALGSVGDLLKTLWEVGQGGKQRSMVHLDPRRKIVEILEAEDDWALLSLATAREWRLRQQE